MSESKPVVLIVDDNETNRDVLSRRVQRYGYATKTADGGREALQLIHAERFDLVLLDIMMPDLNGFQVLERVKQDPEFRNLPIIVISALDDIDSIVKCIQLGAEDYLPKPFNPLILRARVTACLEKKRLRDKEEEHLEEQAINQRVDRELSARLNMQNAAEITLTWAMRRTTAHAAFFGRVTDDGTSVKIVSYRGQAEELHYYLNNDIAIESNEMSRAIDTIMPQVSTGRDDYLLSTTQSRWILPIGRTGQVIGLLLLEDESAERYPNKMLSFLTRLCDRAATAMGNAILYEQVQQANTDKDEFISSVSHELKNPMTSIHNYAKMIASAGQINETQSQFIDTIVANVSRMGRLVADLSDLSYMESGHFRLNLDQVSLHDAVDETFLSLKSQIEQKNQSITLDVSADLPPVHGDRNRIIQILTNLVSNAHKYTKEGGQIKIEATDYRPEDDSEDMVKVCVTDNGIGLRAEDQAKIFTKYFRAAEQRMGQTPGTGLGLRITKQLVELQGGQIWFESQYEKGTSFFFTIPLYIATHYDLAE